MKTRHLYWAYDKTLGKIPGHAALSLWVDVTIGFSLCGKSLPRAELTIDLDAADCAECLRRQIAPPQRLSRERVPLLARPRVVLRK